MILVNDVALSALERAKLEDLHSHWTRLFVFQFGGAAMSKGKGGGFVLEKKALSLTVPKGQTWLCCQLCLRFFLFFFLKF